MGFGRLPSVEHKLSLAASPVFVRVVAQVVSTRLNDGVKLVLGTRFKLQASTTVKLLAL